MRPAAALTAIGCCALLLAGCGDSGDGEESASPATTGASPSETATAAPGSLEALWRAPGEDVAVVPGTSDHATGANRVSFLVVDGRSQVVERPTARVWVARGLKQQPFLETTARLERIGVPGGASADAQTVYVASVTLPGPGTYWYVAEPQGGTQKIQALGTVKARRDTVAPGVGDRAVPSRTPTLRSTGGDLAALSTAKRPDPALYRWSVAESLAAKAPFVVSFATPLYCQSRTCGPVVDVVSATRKRFAGTSVRFINVEIYEDNDPAKGVNRWVEQWKLPTEPFTYVVGRDGVIGARFEGAFSLRELEAAVRRVL